MHEGFTRVTRKMQRIAVVAFSDPMQKPMAFESSALKQFQPFLLPVCILQGNEDGLIVGQALDQFLACGLWQSIKMLVFFQNIFHSTGGVQTKLDPMMLLIIIGGRFTLPHKFSRCQCHFCFEGLCFQSRILLLARRF